MRGLNLGLLSRDSGVFLRRNHPLECHGVAVSWDPDEPDLDLDGLGAAVVLLGLSAVVILVVGAVLILKFI